MSELELEQQLPFTASLTFEQSYIEVDWRQCSLAELCALNQRPGQCTDKSGAYAITGSGRPVWSCAAGRRPEREN